jgi:hypothetical protein
MKLAGNDLFVFQADPPPADEGSASETVSPAPDSDAGNSTDTDVVANETTFQGGPGDDHFVLSGTDFAWVDGNGGIDRLILDASFDLQAFDLGDVASRIHDLEVISLDQAEGVTLRLSDTDVPLLNDDGVLYVLGDFDDEIILEGDWSVVSATATNAAVAPGVSFVHLMSAGGADLYVEGTITQPPVPWAGAWEELITPVGVWPV